MDEWTEEAESAIRLCETWAADVVKKTPCQLFLFGSAIYKGGEQFDSTYSDLDIVCLLPEQMGAQERYSAMLLLRQQKQDLELKMVPALHRVTCDEPGVSIVPITPFELKTNVHKSGARSFFDKNFFYDLLSANESLGIPDAGTRLLRDDRRQALEFVQKVRNEFLSVSANGAGGLADYGGTDPMPKALLRSAAQLAPDTADGEWYDTRLGLELMHSLLRDRRTESPEFSALFRKVSVRRGGRGRRVPLTGDDQLLLAEILFEEASRTVPEEVVTWDIRVTGESLTVENVTEIFSAIARMLPDAKLIGLRSGSIILRIRSSRSGFELIQQLAHLDVLDELLKATCEFLGLVDGGANASAETNGNRISSLLAEIASWTPPIDEGWRSVEEAFAQHIADAFKQKPIYKGAIITRNVNVEPVEIPLELDFLISWPYEGGVWERVGIDLTRLRSRSTFFQKVSQLLQLGKPVILVLMGMPSLFDSLRGDISRLEVLNANIKVVTIPAQS